MTGVWSRRRVMKTGAVGGLTLLLPGCASSLVRPPLEPKGRALFIDVHAHILNGADIPVRGFIAKTVVTDNNIPVLGVPVVNAIARVLDKVVQAHAIGAKEELALICAEFDLDERFCPDGPATGGKPSVAPPWRNPDDLFGLDLETALSEDPDGIAALSELAMEDDADGMSSKLFVSDRRYPKAFRNLTSRPLRRILNWGRNFAGHRLDNARKFIELYGGEGGIDLFVAAMVDYDYWLNDVAKTEIPDQIKVTGAISKVTGDRVLPFAPFDPFRHCAEGGGPLDWIKAGVADGLVAGVKMYPPMGFLPIGNAGLDEPGGPNWPEQFRDLDLLNKQLRARMVPGFLEGDGIARLGADLDDALWALYRWCERNSVPIMAHVAPRRGAEEGYADRADPTGWEAVLEKCPNLRLNLGHFGGWAPIESSVSDKPDEANDWPDKALELMRRYPNVYADVAYTHEILDAPTKYRNDLARMIGTASELKSKLMYGSDWFMLASALDHEDFKDAYQSLVETSFSDMRDGFMGGNAARFLGLDHTR
jgi:hypothetical protein